MVQEEKQGSPVRHLSTRLKRQKLYEAFPEIDAQVVDDVYQQNK